jgi:hypothetical protein
MLKSNSHSKLDLSDQMKEIIKIIFDLILSEQEKCTSQKEFIVIKEFIEKELTFFFNNQPFLVVENLCNLLKVEEEHKKKHFSFCARCMTSYYNYFQMFKNEKL